MAFAHEPIHPGQILLEEFLNPVSITQYRLAQAICARSPHQRDRARQASNLA